MSAIGAEAEVPGKRATRSVVGIADQMHVFRKRPWTSRTDARSLNAQGRPADLSV